MSPRIRNLLLTSTALLSLGSIPGAAGPEGGVVVGGSATIRGQGTSSVIVNQSSQRAIVNWHTFNIGTGESTRFNQPNSSAITLNRVTGGMGPSTINGILSANGRVFVINRDGMLIGRDARINTAGFVASTSDIKNSDFMAGRYNFNIPGRPDASIVNMGSVTASSHGFAALVAPGVRNSGTITATLGTVALASGNTFTLDMYGDKLIQVGVSDQIASQVIDVATGKPLKSLVSNDGALRANGGRVELTAVAARHIVDSVINTKGVIEANSVGMRGGKIVLGGATGSTKTKGSPKQTIKIAGKLNAKGTDKGSKGGTIQVTGEDIRFAAAMIDVSGHSGGGKVLVGGDWAGGKPGYTVDNKAARLEDHVIPTATNLTVDSATSINASATHRGDGGKVILWSDVQTTFAGTILARGGERGGDGGFVEVSGKGRLAFSGTVDTRALHGQWGTLLLDPQDFYIDPVEGPRRPGSSVITNVALQNELAANNVTIQTNNTGNQNGDIFVTAPVTWSAAKTLTLDAHGNIDIGAAITATNNDGGLTLMARSGTITATAAVNVGRFILQAGAWEQNSANLPAFSARDFRIALGATFLRITGGDGSASSPHRIADVFGLQGINSQGFIAKSFVLANNIDASGTASWNTGKGFIPIAATGGPFVGTLDGKGQTIAGLTIAPNDTTTQNVGLFGVIGRTGVVGNLNLANATVSANPGFDSSQVSQWVGVLAGTSGGTISNVHATGAVNGGSMVGIIAGGLVGQHGILGPTNHAGDIERSSASVAVAVGSGTPTNVNGSCTGNCMFNAAGGLVGANVVLSSIRFSSASGNVTAGATSWAGGLVGQNGFTGPSGSSTGSIANSFATGNVTVTGSQSFVGGLAGSNAFGSVISDSQAFGTVTANLNATTNQQFAKAGGLVGQNDSVIDSTAMPRRPSVNDATPQSVCLQGASYSCATGGVSVGSQGIGGGLVGVNTGFILWSFATGAVTGASGFANGSPTVLGGLVGTNQGTISQTFATGNVGRAAASNLLAGGFVGNNMGAFIDSIATGNVTAGDNSVAGGFAGNSTTDLDGTRAPNISKSSATGSVNVGSLSVAGGFAGAGSGFLIDVSATGAVTGGHDSIIGGLVGRNLGSISLSYANGDVNAGNGGFIGGFVGLNLGTINQAYAIGAVTGGDNSFGGGFVGFNIGGQFGPPAPTGSLLPTRTTLTGSITQSYALGAVTGGNNSVAAAFAALNLGSLDQVYGAGRVQGGTNATLAGLVGLNQFGGNLPGGLPFPVTLPTGTATNSYWDMQTTGQLTSAGGTGLNTAELANGLPAGFDPSIWRHGSYPQLVNLGTQQNTTPGPAVIPPVDRNPDPPPPTEHRPDLPPPNEQVTPPVTVNVNPTVPNPVVDPQQVLAQTQQTPSPGQQQPQLEPRQQPQWIATGPGGITAPQPTRLDVGAGRYFYLPPANETRLIADEVVLHLPCDVAQATLNDILAQHQLTVVGSQCLTGGQATYRMRFPSNQSVAGVIKALAQHQIIGSAQANYTYSLMQPAVASIDSGQGDAGQYVPEKLRLSEIHRTLRGNNISIGVIDSEIDAAHPDLKGTITERYDATGVEDNPHAHGTGMAGAIVSRQRLLGVAPGARILAIRAFSTRSKSPESTTYNILRGLDWAINNKVRIVNMSFAGPRDPSLERALKEAHDKGIILIAAAGNAGPKSPPLYPAADRHVIAVTATDIDDRLFTGANRGNYLTLSAPGVDILVPAPNGEYQITTGTSVATAHISGVVALMLERNPRLTPADVRRILTQSAKRIGPSGEYGSGLVDPIRALELAAPRSAAAPVPRR